MTALVMVAARSSNRLAKDRVANFRSSYQLGSSTVSISQTARTPRCRHHLSSACYVPLPTIPSTHPRQLEIMSSNPDIKPSIPGLEDPKPQARASPRSDIKPTVSNRCGGDATIDYVHEAESIRKERQVLEEQHRLRTSVLDLREEMLQVKAENRRLREGHPAVKVEPGVTDTRPGISKSRDPAVEHHTRTSIKKTGDSDDIVFVREAKPRTLQNVSANIETSEWPHSYEDSTEPSQLLPQWAVFRSGIV